MSYSEVELTNARQPTEGLSHLPWLAKIEATGLPAWQIGLTSFLGLSLFGIVLLIVDRYPKPEMYSTLVAFVAIISYFLVFYLHLGRGWQADIKLLAQFDPELSGYRHLLIPNRTTALLEVLLALLASGLNLGFNNYMQADTSAWLMAVVFLFYYFEFQFAILCIDIFIRQFRALTVIAKSIRIDLLQTEFYSNLANSMFRLLRLVIFGLCVITLSYNVFPTGELPAGELILAMTPFYLPGILMLLLYLVPFQKFRKRMQRAKQHELDYICAAIGGDRQQLAGSLVSDDAMRLTLVDLLHYQQLIRSVKEWPFTDRIRSLLLFGVLPPLTWVVAALIEIFIESAL